MGVTGKGMSPLPPHYLPLPSYLDAGDMVNTLEEYKDLLAHVASQIPEKVLQHLKLRIRQDAFGLAPELLVSDHKGRTWRSKLLPGFIIDDEFQAWLCVVE